MLWELKVIKRVNNILNLVEKRKPLNLLLFFTLILDFELTKFQNLKVKCKGNLITINGQVRQKIYKI